MRVYSPTMIEFNAQGIIIDVIRSDANGNQQTVYLATFLSFSIGIFLCMDFIMFLSV